MRLSTLFSTQSLKGFTLVELMLVTSLLLIVLALSFVGLGDLIPRFQRLASVDTFRTEMAEQQLRALSGEQQVIGDGGYYGIRVDGDRFQFFQGQTYSASHDSVQEFLFEEGVELVNCTMPSNTIVFEPVTGFVQGLSTGEYSCEVENQGSLEQQVLVSRYGVTRVVQL